MRALKIVLGLVLLLALALAFSAHRAHEMAQASFKGYDEDEVFFTVPRGASGSQIGNELENKGIIRDRRLFVAALRLRGESSRLQAGEYRFSEPISTIGVVERLVDGDIYTFPATVPEGLTLTETASHLAGQGIGEAGRLEAVFMDPAPVADFDAAAKNLEGYLFPTTYHFTRSVTPEEVARTMVSQFRKTFDESRRAKAEELGLSPREVVTLASVIEKETGKADERPLIGSVFWNRLRRGIPLGSDPTIIYALKIQGTFDGNLRRADLELDSPYNTYRVAGLPPGPIASPGAASIDAVLYPSESDFLYFVSKNDGSHYFSKTLREHTNAVHKYQVEYFRRRRDGAGSP